MPVTRDLASWFRILAEIREDLEGGIKDGVEQIRDNIKKTKQKGDKP